MYACRTRLAAEANTAEDLIEAIGKAPGMATVEDEESSAARAALADAADARGSCRFDLRSARKR